VENHNVGMFEVFEEGGFSDRGERSSLFLLESNLLESNNLIRQTEANNQDGNKTSYFDERICSLLDFQLSFVGLMS